MLYTDEIIDEVAFLVRPIKRSNLESKFNIAQNISVIFKVAAPP